MNERMHVLQMIEDGQVSAAEGLGLLGALAEPAPDQASRDQAAPDHERQIVWPNRPSQGADDRHNDGNATHAHGRQRSDQ